MKWICKKDGCVGEMVATGECYPTTNRLWFHICNVCGRFATALEKYPTEAP